MEYFRFSLKLQLTRQIIVSLFNDILMHMHGVGEFLHSFMKVPQIYFQPHHIEVNFHITHLTSKKTNRKVSIKRKTCSGYVISLCGTYPRVSTSNNDAEYALEDIVTASN
ncbi:CLUMA_CG020741, isoform A [Clunio marinus]|uniref:CLUMA_CG020741, isoform A n=1 Tax=Clunio marinus TaxID=568069 RepID=A0A1J1J5V6_9DIPT|nr:CLUMA_CG020741, isoform A [Clunio marinus]